jgi:hypothetical protein
MARARRRHQGRSPFAVGVVALVILGILVFLGFTKDIPFTRPYQVKAVFSSSNGLRHDSPVRIAGVEVGKVKKIEAQDGTSNTVVTMSIKDSGLPLHRDATAKIRPRIFLEGNFFVDLSPGTPGADELDDGDTITSRRPRRPCSSTRCSPRCSPTRARTCATCSRASHARSPPSPAPPTTATPIRPRAGRPPPSPATTPTTTPARPRAPRAGHEALLGTEPERDLRG